jgi:hypothetical protein
MKAGQSKTFYLALKDADRGPMETPHTLGCRSSELMNQNLQGVRSPRKRISFVHPMFMWGLNNDVQAYHRETKFNTTIVDCQRRSRPL